MKIAETTLNLRLAILEFLPEGVRGTPAFYTKSGFPRRSCLSSLPGPEPGSPDLFSASSPSDPFPLLPGGLFIFGIGSRGAGNGLHPKVIFQAVFRRAIPGLSGIQRMLSTLRTILCGGLSHG